MKSLLLTVVLVLIFMGCASNDRDLYLDGALNRSSESCGTESFLNRYATFQCNSMELEESNDYVNKEMPIHNIKNVIGHRLQRLLVIDEKIFAARLREQDQEVVCNRRLKVVLNPGVGPGSSFQKGWVNYQPRCFSFYNIKKRAVGSSKAPLFTKSKKSLESVK